ncbi:MAG: DUF4339 domain-containing protein, partial [Gloeobacteraceae cyanobacterium ES-bin-144]|nr:DUF4339 domain-containing protein [Verrucomicrobiales bacterium]
MSSEQQDNWHYTLKGKRFGPVSYQELNMAAAQTGMDPRLDMVWRQGMEQWKPAGEIDGLFEGRVVSDPENASVNSNESLGQPSPASDFGPLRSREHFKDGELSLFSQGMTIVTLPLAILIASVGWVLFWLLYDVLWSLLPVDEIRIPWVVL